MAQKEQKESAIKSLYGLCKENPTLSVELCGNIIETISQCYHTATEEPSEKEKFLVKELASFVRGIKDERNKVLKTVDIRSPKTGISVHFSYSLPMAMQIY